MTTKLTDWIGQEGRLFERVGLVFEGLGYLPPTLDMPGGTGAYVANIVEQYRADFTQEEIMQIVEYAKSHTLGDLRHDKEHGWIDREIVFRERSWEKRNAHILRSLFSRPEGYVSSDDE